MASEVREILYTLSTHELKVLAEEAGVDTTACRSKGDYVKLMASSGAFDEKLHSSQYRVRPLLAAKNVLHLQNLATELGVDIQGCETKGDYVARIAASPAAERLLTPEPPASPDEPTQTPGAPASSATTHAATPAFSLAEADRAIAKGRNLDVDFGLAQDVLDQTRMRLEEQNYDRALELAREALVLVRGSADAFERSAWGHALLASEKLIEECGRVGRDVEAAAQLLKDAKAAYLAVKVSENARLLEKLQTATKALYSDEVHRLRQAIFLIQDGIGQAKHIGADVSLSEDALARAREAIQRADHTRALEFIHEADRVAAEAFEKRVGEIDALIPATEKAIGEARLVGAEVDEASRLLEKAKVAMARKEYVLAGELALRSERATLESQREQIEKVMDLRLRQIERAQRLVDHAVPIADEAASYDLPIEDAKRILKDAREVLDQGDYVTGYVLARQADEALRAMLPQIIERRAQEGIVKPSSGQCNACGSLDAEFLDDGWSRCPVCGGEWRWRPASGLWERFRTLIRE